MQYSDEGVKDTSYGQWIEEDKPYCETYVFLPGSGLNQKRISRIFDYLIAPFYRLYYLLVKNKYYIRGKAVSRKRYRDYMRKMYSIWVHETFEWLSKEVHGVSHGDLQCKLRTEAYGEKFWW